jgi:plastocyanin
MHNFSCSTVSRLFSLLALVALAACSSAEVTPAPGGAVPGISVSITGSTCPPMEINLNDQVTWTNEDTAEHMIRVEYPDGEVMVDLGELQPGDTASVTFPQAGTFTYTCTADGASTGTITVGP